MTLEQQLIQIVEEHSLASLTITAFRGGDGYAPWMNVDVQAEADGVRHLGNARVIEGGLVPAITSAIQSLHAKIAANRPPLAPMADHDGGQA